MASYTILPKRLRDTIIHDQLVARLETLGHQYIVSKVISSSISTSDEECRERRKIGTHPPQPSHTLIQPRREHRIHVTKDTLVLLQAELLPHEPYNCLEALRARALEARHAQGGRVGEGHEADRDFG